MGDLVLLRGGGDLSSGVALRLKRAGIQVVIAELAQPLMVRRKVAFAEAVYASRVRVEDVDGVLARSPMEALAVLEQGNIPVLVDPELNALPDLKPVALVDGRLSKQPPDTGMDAAALVIGLGPGFTAGIDCHAVVETKRGHTLGRVVWNGMAAVDTGVPGSIASHNLDRVLRSPAPGRIKPLFEIGQKVKKGDLIAEVGGEKILAAFDGVLRGLVHPSLEVWAGMKVGDLDPRNDPAFCVQTSDKALAVGGGVLEALLSRPEIRGRLWT
jgi:xanthine dehydrogenase accessory factor